MLDEMSAGTFINWQRFDRQFNLRHNRDDIHWGMAISDYRNAHKSETEPSIRPVDVMPYHDPFAADDELSDEELMAKMMGGG